VFTLLGGLGNAMGWLGAQAEGYVAGGRGSAFAGLGYTARAQEREATGVAAAGGVRAFTGGFSRRGFLEFSISQLVVEIAPEGSGTNGKAKVYGPGAQIGYQYIKPTGFTFMVSAGVGHTVGGPAQLRGIQFMFNLGIGHTWRHG